MKITLLSIFLLFSTNPINKPEQVHIGTFEVYMNNQEEVEVRYTGKYDKCLPLYFIKRLNPECDDIRVDRYLDSMYQLAPIELDTCIKPYTPIKITRL